jgi:hypothetical protein
MPAKKYDYKKDVKKRNEPGYQHPYTNEGWVLVGFMKEWDEVDKWIKIKGNRKQFEYRGVPLDKQGLQISTVKMKQMRIKKQEPHEIVLYARPK